MTIDRLRTHQSERHWTAPTAGYSAAVLVRSGAMITMVPVGVWPTEESAAVAMDRYLLHRGFDAPLAHPSLAHTLAPASAHQLRAEAEKLASFWESNAPLRECRRTVEVSEIDAPPRQPLDSVAVAELPLSSRLLSTLRRYRVESLAEATRLTSVELLGQANFGQRSLDELRRVLASRGLHLADDPPLSEPASSSEVSRPWRDATDLVSALSALVELTRVASNCHQVVLCRLGWDGDGGASLEATGQKYGITRERVRQLCNKALSRIQEAKPAVPVVEQALEIANRQLPALAESIEREIVNSGLSDRAFRLEGLQAAARTLGLHPIFELQVIASARIACPQGIDFGASVLEAARLHQDARGCFEVEAIAKHIDPADGSSLAPSVAAVLNEADRVEVVDSRPGWYQYARPEGALERRILKTLDAVSAITLDDLLEGIKRGRYSSRLWTLSVLRRRCSSMEDVELDGDIVRRAPRFRGGYLTDSETAVLRVLRKHPATADEIVAATSVAHYQLFNFSFIKYISAGLWCLRGLDTDDS